MSHELSTSHRLPAAPAALDADGRAELDTYAARALRRQQIELADAVDETFEHVPRALRGLLRRALAP